MRPHVALFCAAVYSTAAAVALAKPNILHIMIDDLGMNDVGFKNGGKTITPALNNLAKEGIELTAFHTFKICAPSRASTQTGRYPFNAGFYGMNNDENHCTSNYTTLAQLLKKDGYNTHAAGKWDIGYIKRMCTAAHRGFDSFIGYYTACIADYWYHFAPNSLKGPCKGILGTDFSMSNGTTIAPATGLNGTYDRDVFSDRAVSVIESAKKDEPFYFYLAFQNVHLACGFARDEGIQAPCDTVDLYPNVGNDTYKVQSAMMTELDYGVGNVTAALKRSGQWDNTLIVVTSDNGGPLDHTTNFPYRGGKHTWYEGGVRVFAMLSGGLIPEGRRGTTYDGMLHSSDWYRTLVEGVAKGTVPANTGPVPVDGVDAWDAIINDKASPRTEVVHQVWNQHWNESSRAIRVGRYKLIVGNAGDNTRLAWPEPGDHAVPFGQSGGKREAGTNHCRAPPGKTHAGPDCVPYCLYDVVNDISESHDLVNDTSLAPVVAHMIERLDYFGKNAPPSSYVYWNDTELAEANQKLCNQMGRIGYLEPVDF